MAKTKLPEPITKHKSIIIGGIHWDIKPLEKVTDSYGSCSTPARHYIRINDHQYGNPNEDYIDTILHECVHAMSSMYNLSKNDLTETQVAGMAAGLEELFIENPDFILWLHQYSSWQREQKRRIK